MNLDPILDRLDGVKRVKPDQYVAKCPAHDDSSPSLALRDMGDRALVHCYAGCTFDEIRTAIGMQTHEFFADGKASPPVAGSVSRRELDRALAFELLTAYVVVRDRAEGKEISPADQERYRLARERIVKAWRAAA